MADSYQNLDVYKLSMKFAYDVYQIVSTFPDFEKFGLSSQLRRAVISVPSNIPKDQAVSTRRSLCSLSSWQRALSEKQ